MGSNLVLDPIDSLYGQKQLKQSSKYQVPQKKEAIHVWNNRFLDMRVNNSIFIFGWRAIHQSSKTAKHVWRLIWTRWLDVNRWHNISLHYISSVSVHERLWSAYSVFAASSSCINHRDWDNYCPSWFNTHFSNVRNVSSITSS